MKMIVLSLMGAFSAAALLGLGLLGVELGGCGYSSQQNELSGQVKKVTGVTPVFCPDRNDVYVSLGVMRNGVGSISNEDAHLAVGSKRDLGVLLRAAETGRLVKIRYDVERVQICGPDHIVTSAILLDDGGAPDTRPAPGDAR